MEILLLLLLVGGLGYFLLPQIMRERAIDSPIDTISDFRRGMRALAISTHNYDHVMSGGNFYSASGVGDPEPYVRRQSYPEDDYRDYEDFTPYPSNRARVDAAVRRQRIIVALWIAVLTTGMLTLIPDIRWIRPLHIVILVLLAGYSLLVILLPHRDRYRQGTRRPPVRSP